MEDREVLTDIGLLKSAWTFRNRKFIEWYELLNLVDQLAQEGLESVCANDPRTLYNLAHYLMSAGDIHHIVPISTDSPIELDKQAKSERALESLWRGVDRKHTLGGGQTTLQELNFDLLLLGWYSGIASYNDSEQEGVVVLWSPADTFPRYADGELTACLHEYKLPIMAAKRKAEANGWSYDPIRATGEVVLSDYYFRDENNKLMNHVLIDNKPVIPETPRDDVLLLVAPVGGFPDRGSIVPGDTQWTTRVGQSILESNNALYGKMNRWLTFEMQILRDTAQPKYQEISMGDPKVQPEHLRQRGAVFHFNPGEGLSTIDPAPMPLELQALIAAFNIQLQKGGFGDALFGLMDSNVSGFALTQAIETANRVLYNHQRAKNFFLSEIDRFWLQKIQEKSKTFVIKGRAIEELSPKDLPEFPDVIVESELATPRDWLEKATVANYLKGMVDDTFILSEVLNIKDTSGMARRKDMDMLEAHPQVINVKLIAYLTKHAEYLRYMGDSKQAQIFEQAAAGLMGELGGTQTGEPPSPASSRVNSQRAAGGGEPSAPPISPQVQPPIARKVNPEVQ